VLLGKPFGFGNTLVSNSKRAEKLVSDHLLVAFHEVYQDDEVSCSFNIDPDSALDSLLGNANDVTIPEEKEKMISKKRKHKLLNILAISYYIFYEYSLVLVLNRMSKKLKNITKKLFGGKSKAGTADTLFKGSSSGSSR
jgi:hypothetical protein